MSAKIKLLVITTLLIVNIGLKAQDRYEYAIVQGGDVFINKITVITSSDEEIVETPKDSKRKVELIKKVEELEKQGWEVFNTALSSGTFIGHYFYMRRKIK